MVRNVQSKSTLNPCLQLRSTSKWLHTSSLAHEARDDSMETRSSISKSLFSGAQRSKVFGSLRGNIGTKLKSDTTDLFTSDFHVKVDCGMQRNGQEWVSILHHSRNACVHNRTRNTKSMTSLGMTNTTTKPRSLPFGLAMRAAVAREKARLVTGAKAETEAERARNKAESMAVVFIIGD